MCPRSVKLKLVSPGGATSGWHANVSPVQSSSRSTSPSARPSHCRLRPNESGSPVSSEGGAEGALSAGLDVDVECASVVSAERPGWSMSAGGAASADVVASSAKIAVRRRFAFMVAASLALGYSFVHVNSARKRTKSSPQRLAVQIAYVPHARTPGAKLQIAEQHLHGRQRGKAGG